MAWYNNAEVNIMPYGIYKRDSAKVRFWNKVDKGNDDECWDFTGGINSTGRGIFYYKGKSIHAHRMSWIFAYGNIPKGMLICHHCDNGKCVNPKHLFIGTQLDNIRDMEAKGRATHLRGDKDPKSKLNSKEVLEIVRLYKTGRVSQFDLGKMFGVSRSSVLSILRGDNWRETTGIKKPLNLFKAGYRPQLRRSHG